MPRVKVTAEMLDEKYACLSLIDEFRERWPDGLYVTKKNCLAVAKWNVMALWWAADALLGRRREFKLMVSEADDAWGKAGGLDEGDERDALAVADADAFWTLAKGVLR